MQQGLKTIHSVIQNSKTDILLSYFSTCPRPSTFIEKLKAENTYIEPLNSLGIEANPFVLPA